MNLDFYTVKDLTDMGFGNRVTIWKKVKRNEFPAPMKMGTSVNSPNRWAKADIEEYMSKIHSIAKSRSVNYDRHY